jgi:flavin-dependent dehydrogenase
VTSVATYSNYQLISRRGHGPGWVMVGDAFGFVDPMLSPGVYIALHSAERVAEALAPFIHARGTPSPGAMAAALDRYAAVQRTLLAAWMDLVAYFYDGRMAALFRAGRDWVGGGTSAFRNATQHYIEQQIALQASGVRTTSRYSRGFLRTLGRHGLRGVAPADLLIR